jgi:hypothetical protein
MTDKASLVSASFLHQQSLAMEAIWIAGGASTHLSRSPLEGVVMYFLWPVPLTMELSMALRHTAQTAQSPAAYGHGCHMQCLV